jgi:hypothetical protein
MSREEASELLKQFFKGKTQVRKQEEMDRRMNAEQFGSQPRSNITRNAANFAEKCRQRDERWNESQNRKKSLEQEDMERWMNADQFGSQSSNSTTRNAAIFAEKCRRRDERWEMAQRANQRKRFKVEIGHWVGVGFISITLGLVGATIYEYRTKAEEKRLERENIARQEQEIREAEKKEAREEDWKRRMGKWEEEELRQERAYLMLSDTERRAFDDRMVRQYSTPSYGAYVPHWWLKYSPRR